MAGRSVTTRTPWYKGTDPSNKDSCHSAPRTNTHGWYSCKDNWVFLTRSVLRLGLGLARSVRSKQSRTRAFWLPLQLRDLAGIPTRSSADVGRAHASRNAAMGPSHGGRDPPEGRPRGRPEGRPGTAPCGGTRLVSPHGGLRRAGPAVTDDRSMSERRARGWLDVECNRCKT